jgi:SAM-dependent methyltransferase
MRSMRLALPAFAVPTRRRGVELLDDPFVDPAIALRSLRDVALSNRLFGGVNAVLAEVRPLVRAARTHGMALSLLDVGSGLGDIPANAAREATQSGVALRTYGLEINHGLAVGCRTGVGIAIAGSALALPFADRSIDIVTCSQVLHHFEAREAEMLLAEMQRVARIRVIVADIRRAWLAAAGLWTASFALGFHPISRHDGVVSVFRGFRREELGALVRAATGRDALVRDRRGFRVTASWSPA